MQHLPPGHLHGEYGGHIGKQREREPLQQRCQAAVRHQHLKHHRDDADPYRIHMGTATRHQLDCVPHGGHIRRDVDDVGDDQQDHHADQKPARRVLAQIGCDAFAGDAPDAGADQLNRNHEGQREKHRPDHAGAKLRAGLGVSGDAGWVIVRSAGDHTGAYMAQKRGDTFEHGGP